MLKYKVLIILIFSSSIEIFSHRLTITSPIKEGEFIDRVDIEEIEITKESGITEIPDYAFLGCSLLKKVELPEGIKKIGFQAFSECNKLEIINFPTTLEDIGSNSFAYCERLDKLEFPKGLKHIGHNAFSFCSSLREAILPDSLEEVESYAFSDCDSLMVVRLPGNNKLLGELIMNCCKSLKIIVQPSVKVPNMDCESYIFDPTDEEAYERCMLKVPIKSEEAYRKHPGWSMFKKIEGLK